MMSSAQERRDAPKQICSIQRASKHGGKKGVRNQKKTPVPPFNLNPTNQSDLT